MRLEAYDSAQHQQAFIAMLQANGMDINMLSTLPKHGVIAFEGSTPIAAGFLRCMEGKYAIFDSYISNKTIEPSLRDSALNRITQKLIYWGKRNKLIKMLAFTQDEHTYLRSMKHGFIPVPYKFSEVTICHS